LLDELTVDVDPQSREQILQTIFDAADAGAAVVYSTHYMEEVEHICSRALLIERSQAVATGTVTERIALGGRQPLMELTFQDTAAPDWCDGLVGITQIAVPWRQRQGRAPTRKLRLGQPDFGASARPAPRCDEFSVHGFNLSDPFISLTGDALHDLVPDSL
jgi:ABC-2 type transport system ATP-binding protein